MKNAYLAAIERMLKHIHDEATLKQIYNYIVYLYIKQR